MREIRPFLREGRSPEFARGLPTRPALGAEGKMAAQSQAEAIRDMLNRQFTSDVEMINRQWGMAGRMGSGQRLEDISQARDANAMALAAAVGGTEMDRWQTLMNAQLMREQMGEQRSWQQAQLEAGGAAGTQQLYGQLGAAGLTGIMQNPAILKWLLSALGGLAGGAIGGPPGAVGGAALTSAWSGMR